jgi:hypothetical protein
LEAEQAIKQAVNCPLAVERPSTRKLAISCITAELATTLSLRLKIEGSRVTEVPAPAAPRFSLTELQVPIHDLVRGQTLATQFANFAKNSIG